MTLRWLVHPSLIARTASLLSVGIAVRLHYSERLTAAVDRAASVLRAGGAPNARWGKLGLLGAFTR
ncbi:hypothetical protein SRO_3843 [Streptomyces rochei]|nr:hypothetical protein SRO_3843 [Streptomyces rochei]